MNFNDDEQIVLPQDSGPRPIVPGRVQLVIRNNNKAPLEENTQNVMLELTGEDKSRSGLDLVAVLDVSTSMEGDKLAKLKTSMLFVMKKLNLVDRLSIVKYSSKAKRLCPLRQMTESSRMELEDLIKGLKASGATNISDGLQTALNILKGRSINSGRVGVVMLMSDGEQNRGEDAAKVQVGDVPVHTFGFGDDQDAKVLKAIADNSRLGGTYSDVRMENLSLAFSQCLGGLLSVVAQDLTVTITQIEKESTLKNISAGRYPQSMDNAAGSVTVRFGDLYIKEVRKVLVDLDLPATEKGRGADILEVTYTYNFDGESFEANPATVTVRRMGGLTAEEQQAPAEVRAEEVRVLIADVIKKATDDADNNKLESAQGKLVEGLKTLGDDDKEKLKAELRAELEELSQLMRTEDIYKKQGRAFAYSLLTSHGTQRQAARGNNIGKFQLFATPAMQEFLQEAEKFDDIDDLQNYMEEVIQALESVEKIVDKV